MEEKTPRVLEAEKAFQAAVKVALETYGKNTWGQKHSIYVIAAMIADDQGAPVEDILLESKETKALTPMMEQISRVVNPSAFAQWLDKHVKGFKREKQGEKLATKFASFEV